MGPKGHHTLCVIVTTQLLVTLQKLLGFNIRAAMQPFHQDISEREQIFPTYTLAFDHEFNLQSLPICTCIKKMQSIKPTYNLYNYTGNNNELSQGSCADKNSTDRLQILSGHNSQKNY